MRNNISILSTRELNGGLLKRAEEKGIAVDIISFIEIQPVRSVEIQQEIENAFLRASTVVFTSMNAVEIVAAEQDGQQPDWNIYCVGNATREKAEKYFGEDKIVGSANSAAELGELIVEEGIYNEVIFFCGDQRRDDLPAILNNHQIDVNEIVVYETIDLPKKIDKSYNGILFFSPSAVISFFKNNKPPAQTVLFAIGNTTAAEIKKFSGNKIIIADEPGKENLLNKTIEYFSMSDV
jgi:uroporphyrinogen-III synthase